MPLKIIFQHSFDNEIKTIRGGEYRTAEHDLFFKSNVPNNKQIRSGM